MSDPVCLFCEKIVNHDRRDVGDGGRATLIEASKIRGDAAKQTFLEDENNPIVVHGSCYRKYGNKERATKEKLRLSASNQLNETNNDLEPEPPTTPDPDGLDWKLCFICGKEKKTRTLTVTGNRTKDRLLEKLHYRTDSESTNLKSKIENVDLVQKKACYHKLCMESYNRKNYETVQSAGRSTEPVDTAMEIIYDYIDENNDVYQFSVTQLSQLIPIEERPHNKTILQRILDHYEEKGEKIKTHSTNTVDGTILCFERNLDQLMIDAWNRQKYHDTSEEDVKDTRRVGKKIREQIRRQRYELDINTYGKTNDIMENAEEDIPSLLLVLLDELILPGKKASSQTSWRNTITVIAHTIIRASRPRCFLSPVLLGLGCFLKKKFGSKFLIDCLSAIGLSCSYSEVQLLELSCIAKKQPKVLPNAFFQWVADNADFNINTLDGHNSWHVMALIQCVTPMTAIEEEEDVIRQVHERRSIDAAEVGKIELISYDGEAKAGLDKIEILDLEKLYPVSTPILPNTVDLFFAYSKWICDKAVPSWNGFMEQVTKSCPYERSRILYHPFINAPPSDKTTINTTLSYVNDISKSSGQNTPVINFDQQLYIIARDIVAVDEKYDDIFVRLGGFHLLISFMGAMCKIMSGSGLEQLWATIYAEGSISQMLIGKAYSRAVRAHLLTNLSLAKIILDSIDEQEPAFSEMRMFLDELLQDPDRTNLINASELELSVRLLKMFENKLSEFENRGPTAKLWVQYYRMTCLLKQFLEAERSGNWPLYVSTIRRMVPFFYSSGHNNYAKSAHIYLQDISTLEERMTPAEFDQLTKQGFCTIRRSDKFFCGISPDQTIEQTTMRLAKTRGGLTLPGRGITDRETAKRSLTMYSLMNICEQFEQFVGVYSHTSEQHVDMRPARIERDNKDVHTLDCWFADHNPFPTVEKIVSIGTGIVGDTTINCHLAEEVGIELMRNATGYTFKTITFKREKQVKPLSIITAKLKVTDKVVAIDPTLIFQRIAITGAAPDKIKGYFDHELAPYPMSLFDEAGMRKGTKSSFYDAFVTVAPKTYEGSRLYVFDGGYLLHKVRWKKDATIEDICKKYVAYLQKHYSDGKTTVIFDGYPTDSDIGGTKSAERLRRSTRYTAPSIEFDSTTSIKVSQDSFLSNDNNKDRLIGILQHQLQIAGFETKQAFEDADRLIVKTALEETSDYMSVTIIGEDVDLLVLLSALGSAKDNVYLRKPSHGNNAEKIYSSQSFKYGELQKYVLFLHAFSGCDTTSAPYSQGKLKLVKVLLKIIADANKEKEKRDDGKNENQEKLQHVLSYLDSFYDEFITPAFIKTAGREIFSALYNGSSGDTLSLTRYKKFSQCATKTKVNLSSLPPSPDAADFHSLRVYLQVQAWLGNELEPTDWGWKKTQEGLQPITTVQPPAPSTLMEMISCACHASDCGAKCGCRKAGVPCSIACKYCSGEDCSNVPVIEIEDEDLLDDDDLDFPSQVVHFPMRSSSQTNSNTTTHKKDTRPSGSSCTDGTRSESPDQEPAAAKRTRRSKKK